MTDSAYMLCTNFLVCAVVLVMSAKPPDILQRLCVSICQWPWTWPLTFTNTCRLQKLAVIYVLWTISRFFKTLPPQLTSLRSKKPCTSSGKSLHWTSKFSMLIWSFLHNIHNFSSFVFCTIALLSLLEFSLLLLYIVKLL